MAAPPSDDPFSDEIGQEPETKAVFGDQLQELVGPAEDSLSEPLRLMPEFLADKPVDISKAVEVPSPAAGRNKNRAGRAKTRLLGFSSSQDTAENPFAKGANTQEDGYTSFPVGWLVVTDGPGRGSGFTLFNGVAQIGRGEGQTVRLDFGDNSISRQNHAAIAYDAEQNTFFIGHGGKANLVRCNDMPVLSTQALGAGDRIRIGETTLHFVPLCGSEFHWPEQMIDEIPHAVRG
ncbi:MAG: FHA domain-containing protein [Rhodobacteraceae bacterium]|nr:FHA domain-containing protein [Paracoccaceae bacterium]